MKKRVVFLSLFAVLVGLAVCAMPVSASERGEFSIVQKGQVLTSEVQKTTDGDVTIFRTTGGSHGITLPWVLGDDDLNRPEGFYLGIRATIPTTLTEAQYKKAQFSFDKSTWESFAETAKFDKTEKDPYNGSFVDFYFSITKDEYEAAAKTDGQTITKILYLSWNGDKTIDDTVKLIINTNAVKLDDTQIEDVAPGQVAKLTIKNNIDDEEIEILVEKGTALRDIADVTLDAAKTKAGYKFVRFYTQLNTTVTEFKGTETIDEDTTIVAEFKKTSTAPTPEDDGNQGTTTKPSDKDETPKTGTTDAMGFVGIVAIISMAGVVTLKKNYNF